jgi:hypothetical protein
MFRSFHSKDRAGKAVRSSKRSFREHTKLKLQQSLNSQPVGRYVRNALCDNASSKASPLTGPMYSSLTSPIVALMVGSDRRVFAAHEDVLSISPFFATALKGQFYKSTSKRVELPDE